MSGKEKFYGLGRSATAGQKRNHQLEEWQKSITNKESSSISSKRKRPRVRFGESVVFLAASQSGDVEEVDRLLTEEGADVNSINKDGLTALHQCCIDDDFEMVQLLVRRGASLDVYDNEGWTPLHAAASCGHEHIVSHLLDHGAFPAPVNNEGDTPEDLVDDDVIRELITEAIERQGVNVTEAKTKEEMLMLTDANRLKNDPSLVPAVSPGGASVVHVAAAKNYLQVLEVLLSIQSIVNNIDSRDEDGWTALHAAVYWENMEVAKLLVQKGACVNAVTKTGDTIDDLCRPEYDDQLEELKQLCESTTRNRCYATTTKRPSLLHSNSREDMNSKPSPTFLKRRSSKDKSMFPKIDIASENAIIQNWTPEEVADGSKELVSGPGCVVLSSNIDMIEETKNGIGQDGHTENNLKEKVNSLKEKVAEETNHIAMTTSNKPPLPPGSSPQSSPHIQSKSDQDQGQGQGNTKTISPQASPKTCKRRPMSGQMMKRLTLWEQQSSSNLNPPPPASQSPAGSASSSPQHVPVTTSKEPSSDISRPPEGGIGEPKRFPFVSKTVPQEQGEHKLKPSSGAGSKRNSYDEARLAHSLHRENSDSSKTSSLPRNARIVMDPALTSADKGTVTSTEAAPTQSVPTEGGVSRGGEGAVERGGEGAKVEVRRELSRGESVESVRSDRSFTEESETNRRWKAKKLRENRKKTQPVPSDLHEQLAQHNSKEQGKDGIKEDGGGAAVKEEVEKERMQFMEQLKTDAQDVKPTSTSSPSRQSAYRPSARPAPRFRPLEATPPHNGHDPTKLSVPDDSPQLTPYDKDESSESRDDEEGSAKQRTQSKSTVRRKPREQRKPTGIVQFDADSPELKNASEEVARLFRNKPKPGSFTSSPESTRNTATLKQELTNLKGNHDRANEEVAELKGKVVELTRRLDDATRAYQQERREKEEKMERISQMEAEAKEVAELKGKVAELTRRLDDATRAYQQERREKEEKVERISQMEAEAKSRDELKVENQRLKDENSALIRVIGKLSRAPIRPA